MSKPINTEHYNIKHISEELKMADKCAICGAEINVFQTQKLADGTCICRKNCRAKGFKDFDFVHGSLPQVRAHLEQVERGTALWNHFFVPRRKKLERFAGVYVAPDLGLMAYVETRFKFIIFGKSEIACVYRIADLYDYIREDVETTSSDGKKEIKSYVHLSFRNVEGLFDFKVKPGNGISADKMIKYFDNLFGIQKTLGNFANNKKNEMEATMAFASAIKTASEGGDAREQAAVAAEALDKMKYGDRTELISRANAALESFRG